MPEFRTKLPYFREKLNQRRSVIVFFTDDYEIGVRSGPLRDEANGELTYIVEYRQPHLGKTEITLRNDKCKIANNLYSKCEAALEAIRLLKSYPSHKNL
jgi:hypothetical protein